MRGYLKYLLTIGYDSLGFSFTTALTFISKNSSKHIKDVKRWHNFTNLHDLQVQKLMFVGLRFLQFAWLGYTFNSSSYLMFHYQEHNQMITVCKQTPSVEIVQNIIKALLWMEPCSLLKTRLVVVFFLLIKSTIK